MKTAILSDFHGNATALSGVLKEIRKEGLTKIFITGDFIGYYYQPDKIFKLLRSWEWEGVIGNHDAILRDFISGKNNQMDTYRTSYGRALDVAIKKLSKKDKQLLISLPERREITIDGKKILLCHGSPWRNDEYLYHDSPAEIFEKIASLGYDFVILGHTHHPLLKKVGRCIIVNPGSVGQPRDEGSNSSWAVADFATGVVNFRRTRFDPSKVIKEAEMYDPGLNYLKEVLTRKKIYYA